MTTPTAAVRAAFVLTALAWGAGVTARVVAQSEHVHHAPAQARMLASPLDLSAADVAAGKAAYTAQCARCHGADGKGGPPPATGRPAPADLTRPDLRTHADGEISWVVANGIPASGMPASRLSTTEVWQVVAYVRTLGGVRLELRSDDPSAERYVWDLPPGFPRPKVPKDNPMSAAKVELGRHLFYDTRLSVTNTFSCATCHEQRLAFTDGKGRGVGATGQVHPRGPMALMNMAYTPVFTWANPTIRSLEAQALGPMFGEDPVELGLSGIETKVWAALDRDPTYRTLFANAFPGEAPAVSLATVTRAIASFERSLISGRAPYDRFRTGEDLNAISASAKRGADLFFSETTECFHCHGGFNFTETVDHVGKGFVEVEFHNTALYNLEGKGAYPVPNTGVHAVTDNPDDMGRFKAPSLRNVAVTAPYMHDGSIATLAEVIRHYEAGGRTVTDGPHRGIGATSPLKSEFIRGFDLTDQQRADLVAFLESLTDTVFLTDPRFGNPWPSAATKGKPR